MQWQKSKGVQPPFPPYNPWCVVKSNMASWTWNSAFNSKLDKSVNELKGHFMEELREEKDAPVTSERKNCWALPIMASAANSFWIRGQISHGHWWFHWKYRCGYGILDAGNDVGIALAHLDSPARAVKFIKSRQKNETIHFDFFWLCSCMPWCGSPFRAQGVRPNKYITYA